MDWINFQTYGDGNKKAFETLCTQLFERYLRRTYLDRLVKFRVVNGDGGDGGVEAYGELDTGEIIAVQAKWFRDPISDAEIRQMRKSVKTAMLVRPSIREYYFCIPRSVGSEKFGRGKKGEGSKLITNSEDKIIDDFTNEIENEFSNLNIKWWFTQDIELQILQDDNDGVHKFWFEKELISIKYLINQFDLQKSSWLHRRYSPKLHAQGFIQKEVQEILYDESYRNVLHENLMQTAQPYRTAVDLIDKFNKYLDESPLKDSLNDIASQVNSNLINISKVVKKIQDGKTDFDELDFQIINIPKEVFKEILLFRFTNLQKKVHPRLIEALGLIEQIDFNKYYGELQNNVKQIGRLFLGSPGSGKTHALSNTVDTHLNNLNSPAIIIKAKGTPSSNWTEILTKVLEIKGWDKNQIFSALETLSVRNDILEASKLNPEEELNQPPTKAVICIDGLEEDTRHWKDWYERMRESIHLMDLYPRIRFVYSARQYFLKNDELPNSPGFKVKYLPDEGDVSVFKMAEVYFSPEHYNITLDTKSLIRGIDSLNALRLFCEAYEGRHLTDSDQIITAERKLLAAKIARLEDEFKVAINENLGSTRKPILEALIIVSDIFYSVSEIDHRDIFEKLRVQLSSYLNASQIDVLIDYLVDNSFMIKNELPVLDSFVPDTKVTYTLAYQSIMELILADKIVTKIDRNEIDAIPVHLLETFSDEENLSTHLLNERIVYNIVNDLFQDKGKLVGEDGFLVKGLDDELLLELRTTAFVNAPSTIDKKHQSAVKNLFLKDYKSRHFVFEKLIYPSAKNATSVFGAEFLHEILINQPSAFARESIWLGGDRYGENDHKLNYSERFENFDLKDIVDPYLDEEIYVPEFALHNEYPLILAWCLVTIDQRFRAKLRIALTKWALNQPYEYIQLLDKIFNCNDPQIQEDLASITLGIAGILKDKEAIKSIAEWSLDHVFVNVRSHRNIIVRQGFRSIVERAFQFGMITEDQVKLSRPYLMTPLELLPIDISVFQHQSDEIYPIVHDLAWYVIKDAFESFLEIGAEDGSPTKTFLLSYEATSGVNNIGSYEWAMAVAIKYIQNLGFDRTEGNSFTKASHGSKSSIFTLEEKYTWLAVHYIQGYLSDYMPLEDSGEFIKDYTEITDIPNPAESLNFSLVGENIESGNHWIINDMLAPELDTDLDFDEAIKEAVESEPIIEWEKWLLIQESEFLLEKNDREFLAIFNYTNLHNSNEYLSVSIDARAVIIDKGETPKLLDFLKSNTGRGSFIEHTDRLVASPSTTTYSNPTDLVWMDWIEERDYFETYHSEDKKILYTVTSVTTNTIEGEKEIYIPSKIVRKMLGIVHMNGHILYDHNDEIKSVVKVVKSENYDTQEIAAVNLNDFLKALEENEKEVVWLVDHYSRKNPLNESIKSKVHPVRSRKYFVYSDGNKFIGEKIWDERFSNVRDKHKDEENELQVNIKYEEDEVLETSSYDKNLVWYLGYGSNLYKERFLCYIKGGAPDGHSIPYEGCRDKTVPITDRQHQIENKLYFSKTAPRWNNGGVAFISTEKDDNPSTLCRLYLVNRQQLEDIAKQETSSAEIQTINFEQAKENSFTIFKHPSWYGKVLYLGHKDGFPIFALTNEENLEEFRKPSAEYLTQIIKGIKETFDISKEKILDYLISKKGIAGQYSYEDLGNLIDNVFE